LPLSEDSKSPIQLPMLLMTKILSQMPPGTPKSKMLSILAWIGIVLIGILSWLNSLISTMAKLMLKSLSEISLVHLLQEIFKPSSTTSPMKLSMLLTAIWKMATRLKLGKNLTSNLILKNCGLSLSRMPLAILIDPKKYFY
jgi:hypothetical protein